MKELLIEIVKHMVDYPDQISVKEIDGGITVVLELFVAKQDLGKVIGIKGRNINAIRTIMAGVSGKINKRIIVEVAE